MNPTPSLIIERHKPSRSTQWAMSMLHDEAQQRMLPLRASQDELRTVIELRDCSKNTEEEDEIRFETPFLNSALAWQTMPVYNAADAPLPLSTAEKQIVIFRAIVLTLGILFGSVALLFFVLWASFPPIREEDLALVHMPRSFQDLKALSQVIGNYNQEHYYRVMVVWLSVFLLYAYTFHLHTVFKHSLFQDQCIYVFWLVHCGVFPLLCPLCVYLSLQVLLFVTC